LPHRNAPLQQEGADLIDDAGTLTDQALADAVQANSVAALTRKAGCRVLSNLRQVILDPSDILGGLRIPVLDQYSSRWSASLRRPEIQNRNHAHNTRFSQSAKWTTHRPIKIPECARPDH
jgi:hypothetical protein